MRDAIIRPYEETMTGVCPYCKESIDHVDVWRYTYNRIVETFASPTYHTSKNPSK